jgi:hypothetical protein
MGDDDDTRSGTGLLILVRRTTRTTTVCWYPPGNLQIEFARKVHRRNRDAGESRDDWDCSRRTCPNWRDHARWR